MKKKFLIFQKIFEFYICIYSGGQLKRDGNVSFCASITTESSKTNNIPLKSPTKFLPEMKKKILFFKKNLDF